MEKNLRDMFDNISAEELSYADCADFDLPLGKASHDRILTSAMRKAGFDMKEKRTIKKKRIVGICLAAALMFGGAIGAYASYNNGIWNGMKRRFDDNLVTEEDIANLEGVTTEFTGTVIENSFEELSFTVEGIVNDSTASYAIITVRKNDGTAFEEPPEGYEYTIGLAGFATISSDPRVIMPSEELYPSFGPVCEYNEDGSISAALYDWDFNVDLTGYADGKVRSSITNIYCVKNADDETDPDWDEVYPRDRKGADALNAYVTPESGDTAKRNRYENLIDNYFDALKAESLYTYEGVFEIEYDRPTNENSLVYQSETNEIGCTVKISSMSVKLKKENNEEERELGYDIWEETKQMTIVLKDGSEMRFDKYSGEISGGASSSEHVKISSEMGVSLNKPIDPSEVDNIVIDWESGEETVIELN